MQIFAVTGTLDEQREKIVELARNGYSEANIYIASNAVFVASGGETTKEVSVRLGIGDEKTNYSGVVIMVNYYWGYYDKELWEWIAARSKSNGS